MQVAQSLGREFTEEEAVILGQAAEVPNTKLRGDLADRRARWISRFECSPNLVKSSHVQILHWCYAEVVLKRITKRTLGYTRRSSELFHGYPLEIMLFNEIHGHADDLSSRQHMAARCRFGCVRRGEQLADLSEQFLAGCPLPSGGFQDARRFLNDRFELPHDRSKPHDALT